MTPAGTPHIPAISAESSDAAWSAQNDPARSARDDPARSARDDPARSARDDPAPRRWLGAMMFLLAASPAIIPIWIIQRFGVDVPYWDQWDTPGAAMLALVSGKISLAHLSAQHMEHRMLIPRMFWVSLDWLTHWNVLDELRLSWLVMCGTSLAVLALIWRTRGNGDTHRDGNQPGHAVGREATNRRENANRREDAEQREDTNRSGNHQPRAGAVLLPWFLCNLLIFHPRQWDNFLSGIGLSNLLPMLFLTMGLVVAASRMRLGTRAILAMPLCFAAQFSMGSGILAWPLVGAVLFWQPTWTRFFRGKRAMIFWIAIAALSSAYYFHGFVRPLDIDHHTFDASRSARFGLTLLGSLLSFDQTVILPYYIVQYMGAELLILFVPAAVYFFYAWLIQRDEAFCRRALIWLAVGGYALTCVLLGAGLREGFSEPMASRYISFSLYLPLSMVCLLPMIWQRARGGLAARGDKAPHSSRRILPAVLGTVLVLNLAASVPQSIDEIAQSNRLRTQAKAALLLYSIFPTNPALAGYLFPAPERLKQKIELFNQAGYFHPALMTSREINSQDILPDAPLGNIEHLSRIGDSFQITGWAFPAGRARVDSIVLTYQDAAGTPVICAQALFGSPRSDIASRFHNPAIKASGFIGTFAQSAIPRSAQPLVLRAWTMDVDTCKFHRIPGELRGEP